MASIDEIWKGDQLGRRQDAASVYQFIMSQLEARRARGGKASYVLNINAEWGHGKSFFLHRFANQLVEAGHVVAEVNAWENDLANEPMIAVMAAIEDAFQFLSGEPIKFALNEFMTLSPILANPVTGYDSRNQPMRDKVTTIDLTLGYLHGLQMPLSSLVEDGGTSSRIARDYFRQEMIARFPGGYRIDAPPVSILRSYPDYVRLAIQFEGPKE